MTVPAGQAGRCRAASPQLISARTIVKPEAQRQGCPARQPRKCQLS